MSTTCSVCSVRACITTTYSVCSVQAIVSCANWPRANRRWDRLRLVEISVDLSIAYSTATWHGACINSGNHLLTAYPTTRCCMLHVLHAHIDHIWNLAQSHTRTSPILNEATNPSRWETRGHACTTEMESHACTRLADSPNGSSGQPGACSLAQSKGFASHATAGATPRARHSGRTLLVTSCTTCCRRVGQSAPRPQRTCWSVS
jgi:hypothetical protein